MSNRKIHWKTFNKLRINDALLKKESKHLLAWISSCYMKNLCCKHSFCIFWRELCPHFYNKRSITWIIMLSWCWHFTQFIGLLLSSQMSNRKIHWKTFNKLRINDALLKKESKHLLAWISSCYMKNLCCKHSFCIFWRELCPHFSNKHSITWIIMDNG